MRTRSHTSWRKSIESRRRDWGTQEPGFRPVFATLDASKVTPSPHPLALIEDDSPHLTGVVSSRRGEHEGAKCRT